MDPVTSILVNKQLPEFVREEYPLFISFLEAYYEFLENKQGIKKNDLITQSKRLKTIFDVDQSIDDFENQFFNTFAPLISSDVQTDKAFLIKNLLPLYQSKGSEQSFRFLFRLLFGEEIQLSYPRDNILIASDGKWNVEKTIKISTEISSFYTGDGTTTEFKILKCRCPITNLELLPEIEVYVNEVLVTSGFEVYKTYQKIIFDVPLNEGDELEIFYLGRVVDSSLFLNRKIVGSISGASGLVEKIFSRVINNKVILETYLNDKTILGEFQIGEEILTNVFVDDFLVDVKLRNISELLSIQITNGGSAYNIGDPVIIESPQATVIPQAVISDVYKSSIQNFNIVNGGAGFSVGNQVFLDEVGLPVVNVLVNSVFSSSANSSNTFYIYSDVISDIDVANTTIDSVSYGLSGSVSGNANTIIAESFSNTAFSNIGEIIGLELVFADLVYATPPSITVEPAKLVLPNANVSILSYGSLGKTVISDGGIGYEYGDELIFTNVAGYFGFGAEAIVSEVNANGTILKIEFVPSKINGTVNVSNSTVTVNGTNTFFEDELSVGRQIWVNGESKTVQQITSNTSLNVNSFFSVSHSNTSIRLYGKYLVGGQGYEPDGLPTITISSANGINANASVVCLMGDGENINSVFGNNKAGEIKTISIVEAGERLRVIPTIDLSGYGDGTAIAEAILIPSLETFPGKWIGSDGLISVSDIKLQGLDYYVDYTYLISSSLQFIKYKNLLKDLLSPSGALLYARLQKLNEIDTSSLTIESEITVQTT
jgi:hypothetical protein